MVFKKDPKVTYTQCAIYIDEHIRDDDDEKVQQTCFEYLWHLFYILAIKAKMFKTSRDYEEYAMYGATQIYLRYQKEKDPVAGKRLKPIKSCLNYIKKVMHPLRVDYQKYNFEQVFPKEAVDDTATKIRDEEVAKIRKSTNSIMSIEYEAYLKEICSTIKNYLKSSPYIDDKAMMHNLYLSCLLTLLKTITLSNKNKARVQNKIDRALPTDNVIDRAYAEESGSNIVIYHLDKSMENYVATLVNRIKKEIVKDLRYIIGSHEPTEQVIKDILTNPYDEKFKDEM